MAAVELPEAEIGAVALTPVTAARMECRAVPLIRCSVSNCNKRSSVSFMRTCTCKYEDCPSDNAATKAR